MADGNLGQDDIDRMLSELGADGGKPVAPVPPTPAPTPAANAALDQDGIDALVAQTAASVTPAPKPPTATAVTAAAAKPAPAGDGMLDQDAIDALVAQAAEAVAAPVKPATGAVGGHLDQNEIDKLLADLDPMSRKSTASGSAATHLDQSDIDRLLNELDVVSPGADSEVAKATRKDAKPASKPAAPAAAAPAPASAAAAPAPAAAAKSATASTVEGPLSQDDIDKLLSQLGAPSTSVGATKQADAAPKPQRTVPPAPQPVASVPAKPADATQALSADEIDAIVAKQAADAPPGSESEAVIAQSDIDALVKQLAQATGSPEAQEVADAIAGKAADIDRLQAEQGEPAGPELTRDAVDVNSVLGRTASTASLNVHQHGGMATVATVATMEWKAARWLLAAAVLLLGICSGALIVLTMSVSGLSGELRAAREVEHPAVDGYADKLRLALAKLGESDEAERARGVRWMEELKRLHPDRAGDVGIALARHFRSREAWRRAADEYAAAIESSGGADDPRVPLEHADCLTRLGDDTGAIRQVYSLLAAEARWTSERDSEGRPMPGLDRNRQTIADAYLMLGRLLARDGGAVMASAEPAPSRAAAEGHAAETEPAHAAAPAHAEPAAAHAPAGGHH